MISGIIEGQWFFDKYKLEFKEKHEPKIKNPAKDLNWNILLIAKEDGQEITLRYRVFLTLKERFKKNEKE